MLEGWVRVRSLSKASSPRREFFTNQHQDAELALVIEVAKQVNMSSGFVSAGTIDQPTERDDEWRKAQQEIEDRRRQKEAENRQGPGKSLFEVLQNNKGDY